jgi:hypothetical protein
MLRFATSGTSSRASSAIGSRGAFAALFEGGSFEPCASVAVFFRDGIEKRSFSFWPGIIAVIVRICLVISSGVLPSLKGKSAKEQ